MQIGALCAADTLPEPDYRTRIAPDPDDDRGIDILADIVAVTALERRMLSRALFAPQDRGLGRDGVRAFSRNARSGETVESEAGA